MDVLVSLTLIILLSIAVVWSGIKKVPGIGIFVAAGLIAAAIFFRKQDLGYLGFSSVDNWSTMLVWSILLGAVIALLSSLIVEPLANKITGETHDFSIFDGMRGNFKSLILYMLMAWLLAAFLEEIIFRGFMITEMQAMLGKGNVAIAISIVVGSIIFGLAHWYQGKSGVISTGIIGAMLAVIFVASDFNLWLPILTHGFIDTVGLTLIYLGLDIRMFEWVMKTFWTEGV